MIWWLRDPAAFIVRGVSNSISGHVLPKVQVIVSFAPMMTGSLPSTVGTLTNLQYLAIVSTSIGGSLPSEIGLLRGVVNLNLENNMFGGAIPSQAFAGMNTLSK